MKKLVSYLIVGLLVVGLAMPLASASSYTGTGQDRVVTLNNPYEYTNATVTIPEDISNETANSFEFNVTDESGSPDDFGYVIWINGTNYGVVNITSVGSDSVLGWINYSADAIPIQEDANITVEMRFKTNWTLADVWYGEIDVLSQVNFDLQVTTVQMLISLLGVVIVVLFTAKIITSIKFDDPKKKGKSKKK